MDNVIKVHTEYTYDQMKNLEMFKLRRPRIVAILLLIAWVGINGALKLMGKPPLVESLSGFLLGLGLIVFGLLVVCGVFYTKKQHESNTLAMRNGFYFEFRESGFVSRNNTPDFKGQKEFLYNDLYKVYDKGSVIYIFVQKKLGFILDPNGAGETTPEEFRTFLKGKVPTNKYKYK